MFGKNAGMPLLIKNGNLCKTFLALFLCQILCVYR